MEQNTSFIEPQSSNKRTGLAIGLIVISMIIIGAVMIGIQYYYTNTEISKLEDKVSALDESNAKLELITGQHTNNLKQAIDSTKAEIKTAYENADKPNWLSYRYENYTFKHPVYFKVVNPSDTVKWLTIEDTKGRIEIFKKSDFAERPFGQEGNETQADLDKYIPKESMTLGGAGDITSSDGYEIWLFWNKGDQDSRDEIRKIAQSITID